MTKEVDHTVIWATERNRRCAGPLLDVSVFIDYISYIGTDSGTLREKHIGLASEDLGSD